MQGQINNKVGERLEANSFVTTTSLANRIDYNRDKIVVAYGEIEAAGMKLMRVNGIGGGAQFVGKRMRRAA